MYGSNYNGRQPNNTSYIKNFIYGFPSNLWKIMNYEKSDGSNTTVLTPSSNKVESLYIPGDIFIDGNIVNLSDSILKHNIQPLSKEITNKILNLKPVSFEYNNDIYNQCHYGFIANELETEYSNLIHNKSNIKYIKYLEIIPLLVQKIQQMQTEINELKQQIE